MRCKITASAVYPKFAKINFVHPKDSAFPGFVREATAFPCYFDKNEKIIISDNDFKHALQPGLLVNVVWSKKLNCFVVRFCDDDFDPLAM